MKRLATTLLSLAGLTLGQQTAWGQCGGINWTGQTSCTSGYSCSSANPWYYQCVPKTSAATSTTKTAITTTTAPLTTTVKVTSSTKTSSVTKTSSAPSVSSTGSFAKTNGLLFNIDGKTEYYAGTNCYWCGFLTNNTDVDHVFADIAASGLKIVRVWGFNDVNSIPSSGTVWYQYLSAGNSQINTGADGLQRLDYVVSSAQSHGLKLIINFVNNWSDYGGMAAYVSAFGGNTSTWYTNQAAQTQYQAYIKAVVSRYSTSTAVFAWELANEPRCSGCDM